MNGQTWPFLICTATRFAFATVSGEYGQLGQGTVNSSDEPRQVEFFKDQGLRVVDVVCGPWNTFVSAIKEDPSLHPDTNILNPL